MAYDPSSYEPSYVDVDDIPIEGPDINYDDAQKRRALFEGETQFEVDVFGGESVASDDLTRIHVVAVLNISTYHLVRQAKSPSDATLGEVVNQEAVSMEDSYAVQFKNTYNDIVESLAETDVSDGETDVGTYYGASGHSGSSTAVNTRDSDRMEYQYPFEEDDRFPE